MAGGIQTQHAAPDYPARLDMVTASTKIDWGEAPDVSGFHGRQG